MVLPPRARLVCAHERSGGARRGAHELALAAERERAASYKIAAHRLRYRLVRGTLRCLLGGISIAIAHAYHHIRRRGQATPERSRPAIAFQRFAQWRPGGLRFLY